MSIVTVNTATAIASAASKQDAKNRTMALICQGWKQTERVRTAKNGQKFTTFQGTLLDFNGAMAERLAKQTLIVPNYPEQHENEAEKVFEFRFRGEVMEPGQAVPYTLRMPRTVEIAGVEKRIADRIHLRYFQEAVMAAPFVLTGSPLGARNRDGMDDRPLYFAAANVAFDAMFYAPSADLRIRKVVDEETGEETENRVWVIDLQLQATIRGAGWGVDAEQASDVLDQLIDSMKAERETKNQ